jgi:hypothetical protein
MSLVELRASIATRSVYASGVLGAISVLFYMFAAWHMHFALRSAGPRLAAVAAGAFAAMLATTGIYHAVFVAQNFGARVALMSVAEPARELAISLPAGYASLILNSLVIPSGVLFTAIFGYATLAGPGVYPRWFVALTPFSVLTLYAAVAALAPSPDTASALFTLMGNVYNVAITCFFAVSTIWLMRLKH